MSEKIMLSIGGDTSVLCANAVVQTVTPDKKSLLKKIWSWIKSKTKAIVTIICQGAASQFLYVINNAENQALAKLAICEAIRAGLTGEKAWEAAMKILEGGHIYIADDQVVKAIDIKLNVRQVLLQLVYSCLKNGIKIAIKA